MFDETLVVQSAISAFNNAALSAPAFLWWAILALPLFVMVYFCGNMFADRIGWRRNNILSQITTWTAGLTFVWMVLFGGNYDVLRDNASMLPFMSAAILFLCSLFVASHTRNISLPRMSGMTRRDRVRWGALIVSGLVVIGMSDTHAWWGPLLQIGATVCGLVMGRRARREMTPVAGTLLIILASATAILMQPEFFRFGQLGALTIFHLGALGLMGAFAVATIALNNVNARGRIYHSAYIKLKWMARVIVLLGAAMFLLTESVPVYLGMLAAMFAMFALSIWHTNKVPGALAERMFAATLISFGVITGVFVITALGVLYWANTSGGNTWRDGRFLL